VSDTDKRRFRVLPAEQVDTRLRQYNAEYDDYVHVLVEFDEAGRQVRYLGEDRGEPEDQTFLRDWSWVETELNRMANEVRRLETAVVETDDGGWHEDG